MKKLVIQGLILIVFFLAAWMALAEINWMTLFKVEQVSDKTSEKLGDLFWDMMHKTQEDVLNEDVTLPIDSILKRICTSNDIDVLQVKLHILRNDEVNAFALPGNHLIIYTGLIADTRNESELAGVISHELAHMNMNHVTKKLMKEVGLSAIISMTSGNSGGEILKETAKMLSSTAYDRNLEREADIRAADYLINSNISPDPFADFLARLSESETTIDSHLSWISTHPESRERAEYILEYRKGEPKLLIPVLTEETWTRLRNSLESVRL